MHQNVFVWGLQDSSRGTKRTERKQKTEKERGNV